MNEDERYWRSIGDFDWADILRERENHEALGYDYDVSLYALHERDGATTDTSA